ncbi:MAG: hypothetical protein R2865_05105 [Deinococcales bacterium]
MLQIQAIPTIAAGVQTRHLRFLADVNGDDRQDIVGFAGDGGLCIFFSHYQFSTNQRVLTGYGYNSGSGGWRIDKHQDF